MKKNKFYIDNLKCTGCESTIIKGILALNGVDSVQVDQEAQSVEITSNSEIVEEVVMAKLSNMGYPSKGTSNAFQKAKSYVSCAIGKVSNNT